MVNWDNFISIQNITTSMRATQPLTPALGARPAVQPQSCREMRVKLRNHQNINTTNPTRKETRFPFHYHVTFRVCPTAKSSHRAKIVSRGIVTSTVDNIDEMFVNAEQSAHQRRREQELDDELDYEIDQHIQLEDELR